jgi:hypothetical protein
MPANEARSKALVKDRGEIDGWWHVPSNVLIVDD